MVDLIGLQSDDVLVTVDSLTEMLVLALFGATEYRLGEQGRVYKKLISEMKELVHEDIMHKLKSKNCCSTSENIDGTLTDLHQYGGKLFTVSFLVSALTLNPLIVISDSNWGPRNYNFYTIGNMKNDIRYSGSMGKSPALFGTLCCYSYSVTITAKIRDTFDFVPDKPNNTIKNKIYNAAASIWESLYNDLLGAERPEVVTDVTEYLERSGCY